MKLQGIFELRGVEKRVASKSKNEYFLFRIEDTESGESIEVMSRDNSLISICKKGTVYLFDFDYSIRYKNLEIKNIKEVK